MNESQRRRMRATHERLLRAHERRETESEGLVRDFEALADKEEARESPHTQTQQGVGRVRE